MTRSVGQAVARVGLLGNPSDGYGGRVLAMAVPSMQAHVTVVDAEQWDYSGSELLEASVAALHERRPELVDTPAALSFTTTIPRQVGLSGSSAIVMAALRAFANRANTPWDLVELARTALEVETQVLGWVAGPQDRVVQAYGGLVDMDFATPWDRAGYHRLDADQLPPLFVAWDQSAGEASHVAHGNVRQRWLDGDPIVQSVLTRFGALAAEARSALDNRTAAAQWPELLREAFALRAQIWTINKVDTALVQAGRSVGAGVAFAGSGGAVVGCVAQPETLEAAAQRYHEIGAGFLVLASGSQS